MAFDDDTKRPQQARDVSMVGRKVIDVEGAVNYWQELFESSGPQPRLHCFPLEYEEPRSETRITLPDELFQAALQFCETHNFRLEDVIYAVWAIVADRHGSGGRRTAAFTVTDRSRMHFEQNGDMKRDDKHFPLILQIPEDANVLSWIRHVEEAGIKASAHAHIGYQRIVELSSAYRPQVKVSIDRQCSGEEIATADADHSLVFSFTISTKLEIDVRHNSSVPSVDVRVLLDHFTATLHRAMENPQSAVSNLSIISTNEADLLQEYGKPALSPSSGLVHHLVERQARLTPDADAVQFEQDEPLAYSMLNKLSNQLARELIAHGASSIPVNMRPSVHFIVALLAILKAGAAYVILDPDVGAARRSFIVNDVQANFVLVDESTAGEFPQEYEIKELLRTSKGHDENDLDTNHSASNVAYVIYTSGSSGHPKAVLLEHGAAYNGLQAFPHIADLRQLLFYSPVFSAAQRSIWATLSVGGCLCLASKENLTVKLPSIIDTMRINSVDMTTTTTTLISPDQVPSLKRLVLGGEMANSTVIQRWAHRVELYSSYGLSECTQLNWRCRLLSESNARNTGQPADTTTSYIFTPDTTALAPLLIPGELCLGGAQLARGYLNQRLLTEERFIPHPYGSGLLYRTGDLAVRHADGSIEIIGRIDFQVKINGQRVDPGEPNTLIQSHDDVEHSAVVPALVNHKMLLVAVVASRTGTEWDPLANNLRSYLRSKVPLYMIPSFWVPVAALPLNANGKTDIAAVRVMVEEMSLSGKLLPDRSGDQISETILTHNESLIRRLWAELLSLPEMHISLQDSFVSLGGTSLEAIQVISRLQSEHALFLKVEDIILGNTLSHIASLAQNKIDGANNGNPLVPFALLREPLSVADLSFGISEIEDAFPVTPFQEATIANTILGGKSYIYSRSYSFTGYDTAIVKSALLALARSEALLRTTFVARGASFVQVIKKTAEVPWETPSMSAKEYLQRRASDLMFAGDLWWRAAALPGSILVITLHHALFDYWSNEFLSQDLTSILLQRPPVQRPAFRQYVERLQQSDEVTMKTFWSNYLADAQPSRIGPYSIEEATVTAKLRSDLKSTASQLMTTPSVLLYAAWSVVLASATSTNDVTFGITLSGREAPIPGILDIAGPTLMIVPLRIRVDRLSSFKDHLKSVQDSLWDVAKHAQYGLRQILRASKRPKDLVDTMVNFLIKIPVATSEAGLLPLSEKNLGVVENMKLEVNNDSLDCVTLVSGLDLDLAQNLVDMVATILETSSSAPLTEVGEWNLQRPTTEAPFLLEQDEPELQLTNGVHSDIEMPVERQDTRVDVSNIGEHRELAHAAFQRKAAAYPSRIAVQDASGKRITYAGLAVKVNQLASVLTSKGIKLEQVVPIMFEKSINTVVAIYGILVAGGAFLPLGPENPRERNLGILEDLEGKIAITDRQNADFFDDLGHDVIILDDLQWESITIQGHTIPGLTVESLAYVIYTSGSSGKPKGTLLVHEGVSVVTREIIEATNTESSHRFLWVPNYTFDGSLDTLFTALSSGCTLCVAPQSLIASNLTGLINAMNVNRANMTPSMTTLINPKEVPTMRILITGGEAITPQILAAWSPRVTIYNAYGPTEATICITTRPVHPGINLRNVGRPFGSVIALILDPDSTERLSDGSVGELCLSGPQLARGYLNRPDATAKAFHNGPHGRIYRTGDLAKLLPNGDIELYGRKDDQVKINGYRIELGEIESVVMKASLFDQCVVIAATVLKKKQLVGFYTRYVESNGKSEQETGLLLPPEHVSDIGHVKDRLTAIPNYMIPTIWLPVSKLPFSAAGKIDRKRLQATVESMADGLLKYYLPKEEVSKVSTETETILQSLWSALFDTPPNEIHANSSFHAMGGDSISALNLVSLLRRHGYEVKVSDILSRNNLRQQAALMDVTPKSSGTTTIQRIQYQPPNTMYERLHGLGVPQADIEDIYPCSPGQVEFLTQGNKNEQFWQLMATRELPPGFDFDRWIQLTTKLTQNNPVLRALYLYSEEGNPQSAFQVILKTTELNLQFKMFETVEEKQSILEAEWEELFDPSKPFVRYTCLINTQNGARSLAIKLDHASYDGTLLHIFDDQFKALDRNLPIPKHTPFREFIDYVISMPKQPQLAYWKRLLEDRNFEFPTKTSIPKVTNTITARVDPSVCVDVLASSNGITAPIVFQTAYSLLLAHLSGTRDVIYDNLITGRNVPLDNPQLIDGNCANFLPFYSSVVSDKLISDLLQETQSEFWTATENGLVSLGEIYNALGRNRIDCAAKCLFCFQPFEPASAKQDPMRWIVMKMSENTMYFNYAIQLEVVKGAAKGEYVVRFGYDGKAFTNEEARDALSWYVECLEGMGKATVVKELGV